MEWSVEVEETRLLELLRELLSFAMVDEQWYLEGNPDVAEAVRLGIFPNGKAHYVRAGYFENRLPRPVQVDERWYLETYPDVAQAVREGRQASAARHFYDLGFAEGRLPYEGWSVLWDQPPEVWPLGAGEPEGKLHRQRALVNLQSLGQGAQLQRGQRQALRTGA